VRCVSSRILVSKTNVAWPRHMLLAWSKNVPICKRKSGGLVVEDDELIRMHAADMVHDLGFETLEAANADDAISLLARCSDITVVFTDVQMPCSTAFISLPPSGIGGRRLYCW
jgi:hypothetical protein